MHIIKKLDFINVILMFFTELKVLNILGLELMPKITDTAFSMVFRHVSLKKLILGSNKPLRTVSKINSRHCPMSSNFYQKRQKFLHLNFFGG